MIIGSVDPIPPEITGWDGEYRDASSETQGMWACHQVDLNPASAPGTGHLGTRRLSPCQSPASTTISWSHIWHLKPAPLGDVTRHREGFRISSISKIELCLPQRPQPCLRRQLWAPSAWQCMIPYILRSLHVWEGTCPYKWTKIESSSHGPSKIICGHLFVDPQACWSLVERALGYELCWKQVKRWLHLSEHNNK